MRFKLRSEGSTGITRQRQCQPPSEKHWKLPWHPWAGQVLPVSLASRGHELIRWHSHLGLGAQWLKRNNCTEQPHQTDYSEPIMEQDKSKHCLNTDKSRTLSKQQKWPELLCPVQYEGLLFLYQVQLEPLSSLFSCQVRLMKMPNHRSAPPSCQGIQSRAKPQFLKPSPKSPTLTPNPMLSPF